MAAIKGITVEIGGDTKPLDSALKGVDKTSRGLQSELNKVNKNLKFNPKDTVMLQQKQKLLAESISNTKVKLETLKEAEKQAQEQFKQGKISEEQYRELQREVSKTENQLKNLEEQQEKVGTAFTRTLDNASEKLQKVGGKITDAGKKMSLLSGGIAAVGAGAVKAFDEVDEGVDNMIKATGATGEAAEDLENVYKDLASTFEGEFGDMGSALGEVNTRFGYTGESAKQCTEQFLRFAKINGTNTVDSIKSVSRAMENAGIKSNEYGTVLDQLTIMAQATGTDITKLTENLTKYGASTRAMGMDTKNTIALLGAFEKSGVNTETVMAGMTKASAKWSKEGKDSKKEFNSVVEAIKKAKTPVQASQIAIENFGTKSGTELAEAVRTGKFAYSDFVKTLEKSKGTVNSTFENTRDGMDDVKVATNSFKVAAGELGAKIMEALAPVIQKITEIIKKLTKQFSGLDDGTKRNIIRIGGLVVAIGPALIILGKFISLIGKTVTGFKNMYKFCSNAISGIKNFGSSALSGAKHVATFAGNIAKATASFAKMAAQTIVSTAKLVAHKAATIACTVAQKAMAIAQAALNLIMSLNPISLIIMAIVGLIAMIVLLWNKCEWFRNLVKFLWEGLKAGFSTAVNFLKDVWGGICEFFGAAWSGMCDGISAVFTGIKNVVVGIAQGMVNMVIKAINFCIGALNKLRFDVPDWVPIIGGEKFGFDIKQIQEVNWLHEGGIVSRPQLFGVGDGYNGKGSQSEAVIPLDKFYKKMEQIMSKNTGFTQNLNITTPKPLSPYETARLSKQELRTALMRR